MQAEKPIQEQETKIHNLSGQAWIVRRSWLPPLCIIWGLQWVASAAADIAMLWLEPDLLKLGSFILAAAATAVLFGRSLASRRTDRARRSAALPDSSADAAPLVALPALLAGILIAAAVWGLELTGIASPVLGPLLRALLLAAGFVQLGRALGRPLLYIGVWLLALTAVTSIWYLGYAPIALEGMGGLALLAGGWMLRAWAK